MNNNKNDVCVCVCLSNGEYFIHTVLHEEAAHIFVSRQQMIVSVSEWVWISFLFEVLQASLVYNKLRVLFSHEIYQY